MKKSTGGALILTGSGEGQSTTDRKSQSHNALKTGSNKLSTAARGQMGGAGAHWCLQSLHTDSVHAGSASPPTDTGSRPETDLSMIYFPFTLGTTTSASGRRLPPATSVFETTAAATAANGRYKNTTASGQGHPRSRTSHRGCHPGSAVSSTSSASTNSFERIQSQEDPRIGAHHGVLLSSPFESALAQLRLDRLRIEEEHLLEMKRQGELERTRDPLPKWYAMRSSQFGRELKKHNELLRGKDSTWQEHVDYRATLEEASRQFQHSFSSGTH